MITNSDVDHNDILENINRTDIVNKGFLNTVKILYYLSIKNYNDPFTLVKEVREDLNNIVDKKGTFYLLE
jgi:hypothetical protein